MKFILKRTRPRFAEINSASYLVRALKSLSSSHNVCLLLPVDKEKRNKQLWESQEKI